MPRIRLLDVVASGERCHMVIIIGLVTMGALVWVLTSTMARESEAEKRCTHLRSEQGCLHPTKRSRRPLSLFMLSPIGGQPMD